MMAYGKKREKRRGEERGEEEESIQDEGTPRVYIGCPEDLHPQATTMG